MSNEPQNPIPEESPIPPSPKEPIEPALENTAHSEPVEAPPEAPESPPSDFSLKSNDIPLPDSTLIEVENEPNPEVEQAHYGTGTEEKQAQNEPVPEPQPEADQPSAEIQPSETALEPATAQMGGDEPLTPESEIKIEPNIQETKPEPVSAPNSNTGNEIKLEPEPEKINPVPVIVSNKNKIFELLVKAKNAIQFRKKKKLDKVMAMFLKKSKITNDEVEKFLHVSDATATRYLSQLRKEGKIKQSGKTGKNVFYSKI